MEMPVVVWVVSSTQPTRNIGAHDVLCQSPSIDASLSGCSLVTSIAWFGPKTTTLRDREQDEDRQGQLEVGDLASSTCRFLSRYQALTLSISAAPTVHDADADVQQARA